MTVVGLHPEELFDKLLDDELSPAEAERLRQHLKGCEVCRFEYAARLDFQAEALELAAVPPPSLPLRPLPLVGAEREHALRVETPRRRRRRRLMMVGLAAAALVSASAAVAASVTGRAPWNALGTFLSEPKPTPAPVVGVAPSQPPLTPPVSPMKPVVSAPMPRPAPEPAHQAASRPARAPRKAEPAPIAAAPTGVSLAAPAADAPAVKEPPSAAKLFGDANQARRAGDIGRASGLYRLLQEQYPGSPEAELSRVTLALLLLDNGDAQAALVGFERYLAGSSRGLEAEALVGRARALGRLGRRDLEVAAWQEVQRKYPRSVYGRQATERLAALGQP